MNGNLTVSGDLTIKGTTTTVHHEDKLIEGNFLVVNGTGEEAVESNLMGQVILTGEYTVGYFYAFSNTLDCSSPFSIPNAFATKNSARVSPKPSS